GRVASGRAVRAGRGRLSLRPHSSTLSRRAVPSYICTMDTRRVRGLRAEDEAARTLTAAGLSVIDRNVRLTGGELDLVCRDGDAWVFVEVKARRRGWDDAPRAAVAWRKQHRLVTLALRYLRRRGLHDVRCRFDVVEVITDDGRPAEVRHVRSAFDASSR